MFLLDWRKQIYVQEFKIVISEICIWVRLPGYNVCVEAPFM